MGYTDKLHQLCAMRGLDQSALAERLGISKSSMSRILTGVQEPKLTLAYDLAKTLGVSLDYLVDESLDPQEAAHMILVNEEEMTVLKIVRRLGIEVSIDRLLAIHVPSPPPKAVGGKPGPSQPPRPGGEKGAG